METKLFGNQIQRYTLRVQRDKHSYVNNNINNIDSTISIYLPKTNEN